MQCRYEICFLSASNRGIKKEAKKKL